MKSCTGSVLKLAVFVVNGLFVLFSVLIVVFAGLQIAGIQAYKPLGLSTAPFIALVAVGSFLLILTFLACCGALLENQCMLNTFAYIVGAIVIVELVAGVLAYRFRDQVEDNVIKAGQKLVNEYEYVNATRDFIDSVQWGMQCCGMNSTADWDDYRTRHVESSHELFPDSCCYNPNSPLYVPGSSCITPNFEQTCLQPLVGVFTQHSKSLLVVVGCFIGVQVLSMLMACCLATSVRREYHQFV